MSSDEEERQLKKQIFKNPVEVQKARLDRLMKNVEKPVFIPDIKEIKPPRAFQPHEFVRNVMGASAGAGSGEFDIYRGCRRRQMIREAYLNREAKEKQANAEWLAKVENSKKKAEIQTAKRRRKRLKRKENLKTKKYTDIQNSNKTNESTSSSSDEGCEESVKSKTNKSDSPLAITEEDQLDKEPLSSLSAVQQHQKTDIRNHLRYRQQINSSDEEVDEKEISS